DADEHVEEVTASDTAHGDNSATHGEVPTVTQEPSIPSPTPPTLPPQPPQDLPSTSQVQQTPPQQSQDLPSTSQEALDAYAAFTRRVENLEDPEEESTTIIPADTKSKDKGKGIMVEESKPMKKKQQVEMDEEYARKLHEELNKDINWDVAIEHVKQKAKEDPFVQRYQSINETPAHKVAKRRQLNEDVKDLKKHLEIVPDEDDNVYTKATPLARKVPVVDYEIIHLNNKPHYKIIRADGIHQLYVSFLTLLKNFDREDLELLWSLVKERFSTSKPNNCSDDFLLTTLGVMFERPDGQAQVWKNQRTTHGQAKVKSWKLLESCGVHIITFTTTHLILLVERRYPLSRFTLDQMLNATKEQMKEEENRALQTINETLAEKVAKRRKLNEEVEDLKIHLEIVLDEDDDVYTEATPLARKVPVVDYEMIELNNKPYYKIIRADGTH
nr:hypothetical protein [Tanacetum cinerariifolium]